jgi:hypothetical protein
MSEQYSEGQIARIGESVDELMKLDVANRGIIGKLYAAVRERTGKPLCMNAAEKLKEFLGYRDFVFIIPGSLIYPYKNLAETDGPLGAAALARCLILGIGARPIFVVDAVQKAIMEATCRGAGSILPIRNGSRGPNAPPLSSPSPWS